MTRPSARARGHRRTDVGSCPDRWSMTRLVGVVLVERRDERTEGRRWRVIDVLARLRPETESPTDTTEELTIPATGA